MKNKKLKVFHGLVNYGTQAGLFAKGLREKGIDAISVSGPDPFKRQIDVELLHGGNWIEKIVKHSINWIRRFYWFFKYNTFHFYYGTTLFPKQMDLPFYKIFGKKIIMEYLGYDVQLYQYSLDKYEVTNVKYYKPHKESLIADKKKSTRLKHETPYIDKQLVCAPYLLEFVPNAEILPLAIDLSQYQFSPKEIEDEEITIMHAPTSRGNKGTEFIMDALYKLIDEGYKIKILLVENISHEELKNKYKECDIFIDQILGGWYGTAAIEAMAIGRATVCFIRKSYCEQVDYGSNIPIINAEPKTIYTVLKQTLDNKHILKDLGRESREFVENVHDLNKITEKLISIYKSL